MMKKLSFLGMALVAGLSASAQSSMVSDAPAKIATEFRSAASEISVSAVNRTVIWTNGFDNPADWTASLTASNTNPYGWYINDSIYTNNWRSWESADFQNGQGNFAFVNNGDPTGGQPEYPATAGTPHVLTLVNQIDVTGYESTGFGVSFDLDGAKFVDDLQTYISGDNGSTWTLVGDLSDVTALTNANPVNEIDGVRRFYSVDPLDYNSSSSVLVRFTWDGMTNGGDPSGITYGMMIDNIALETLPADELDMLSFESIAGNPTEGFNQSWALGQIPADRISERYFMAIVQNNGAGDKDVYINLSLTSPSGAVIALDNADSTVTIGGFGSSDTILVNFAPAQWEIGEYNVVGTARSVGVNLEDDLIPANNDGDAVFSITNNTLASNIHDYDVAGAVHDNLIDVGNGFDELQEVTYYNRWIQFETLTLKGVSTSFRGATEEGAKISFGIYNTTDNILDAANPIFVGDIYDEAGNNIGIPAAALTGRAFFPFQEAVLQPDFTFVVNNVDVVLPGSPEGIIYAGAFNLPADAEVAIGSAGTGGGQGSRQTSLEYGPFGENGALATFLSPAINVIEFLRVDDVTSVNEAANRPAFYLAQNRPNPFNGGSTVTYQLNKKANNVSFEVFDVTGKQVMVVNEGTKGAGQYNIELNGSDFTTGLYYYSLTVKDRKSVV